MAEAPIIHFCHWPGCDRLVVPRLWGCSDHWFKLPPSIRAEIWRTYREGQEIDKDPSPEYLKAARRAQDWIRARKPKAPPIDS